MNDTILLEECRGDGTRPSHLASLRHVRQPFRWKDLYRNWEEVVCVCVFIVTFFYILYYQVFVS